MSGNLLIVDDNPAALKLLKDILAPVGYGVRPFNNGDLALRSARIEAPELILLDIRMPGMDGFEVCRRLKEYERLRDIPVIFISAASELEDKVKAFQAGGVDYITKPFQKEEVLARVKTHITLHRARQKLEQLNETLELRVQEEVARNREQDLLLNQQSRLAAMGQMIHNIAHQWKQPLNALSLLISNIKDDYDYHELTADSLATSVLKAHALLSQMSNTIDDFRNFFRPDSEAEEFEISRAVENALAIMEAALKNNHIELIKSLQPGLLAYGFPNQFAHAVLNLLANAKEAIQCRRIQGGRIEIKLTQTDGEGRLTIQDNGGGIAEDILPKIFDPYFTTKDQGSGIGLYMTKMIVERNMKGRIVASNNSCGALFTISIPLFSHRSD